MVGFAIANLTSKIVDNLVVLQETPTRHEEEEKD